MERNRKIDYNKLAIQYAAVNARNSPMKMQTDMVSAQRTMTSADAMTSVT